MGETLKEKTTSGLFWGGMNNLVQQGLGLLFGIVLGRLLSPDDYGMMAMIIIFQVAANALQESGFKSALANLRQPQHRDYNAVFWFNIIVGLSAYAVLFFCAPLIARYYHTPELVALCRVAFLNVLFAALGTSQSAWLFCNLRVKEQAKCNMTATVASNLVGVTLALCGCSYWSLAFQSMAYISVNSLLLWHFSPWRPTLSVDFGPVRRMFPFSCKLLATTILDRVNANVMNILLGHYFSKADVGNYNQAYQWDNKAYYLLQGTLGQVAQPVFTNVADERERQLHILRKLVRFTAFLSFPLLFGFGMVAREFIVITITAKWLDCAALLQLLTVSGAFIPICTVLSNLLVSKGRSGTFFWVTFALCVALVVAMVTLWPYGIRTMVVAYVVTNVAWTFVWHFFVRRLTGYGLWAFAADILPFCLVAAVVMGTVWWLTQSIHVLPLLLLARVALAVVLYYALMKLLHVKMLDECVAFFRKRMGRANT